MTNKEFQSIQQQIIEEIFKIGSTKGAEYANSDIDRFTNFKEVANEIGITKYQCLWTYVKKHLRAIDSAVKRGAVMSEESLESRLVDNIVYSMLMIGMLREDQRACNKLSDKIEQQIKIATGESGKLPRLVEGV